MPEDTIELEIEDGIIRTIYKDENRYLLNELGFQTVARASNVEWEHHGWHRGWAVRSAHDPELAIRIDFNKEIYYVGRYDNIALFDTREEALKEEIKHFWELLPPRSTKE